MICIESLYFATVLREMEIPIFCSFSAISLSLKGFDRLGLINEISRYISFVLSVNMKGIYLNTDNGVFDGYIDLYVHDRDDLEKLIRKLTKTEGIQSVVRTDL